MHLLVIVRLVIVFTEQMQQPVYRVEQQFQPGVVPSHGGLACGDIHAQDDIALDWLIGSRRLILILPQVERQHIRCAGDVAVLPVQFGHLQIVDDGEADAALGDVRQGGDARKRFD